MSHGKHRIISNLEQIAHDDQARLLEIARLSVQIKRIKADLYGDPGSQVEGHVWQDLAEMQIEIGIEICVLHLGVSEEDACKAIDQMRLAVESLIHNC